jgi:hypothetical protein
MVGIDRHRSAMIGQRMRSDHNDWHASVVCRVESDRVELDRVESSHGLHACIGTRSMSYFANSRESYHELHAKG